MSFQEKRHLKSAWVSKGSTQPKQWGHEDIWGCFQSIHGKILHIKAGQSTSFKKHCNKNEVFYILAGKVEVLYGNEKSLTDPLGNPFVEQELGIGDVFCVQSDCPYRLKAMESCQIIEIGDNLSDYAVYLDEVKIKLK